MLKHPHADGPAWHVVHTKPKQEFWALENLQNQAYDCFLPTMDTERVQRGKRIAHREPLFSRYLFVRLNPHAATIRPVCSTRGVNRLLSFGGRFATVPNPVIEALKSDSIPVEPLFSPGEQVLISDGPLAGLSAVYQLSDGDARAIVLVELLSRPQHVSVALHTLRKSG